ncbi:281_t:CDS:10, partial [Entrophospora sp. SA101]
NNLHGLKFINYNNKSPQPGDKVIVAMSGGVDSSVSAYLLKRQGYLVEGIYMRNWDLVDDIGACTSDRDWSDVQKVCEQLEIPCNQINLTKEYWLNVFIKMIHDYENGITPNPDIICNREIKFGVFLDKCLNSSTSISQNENSTTWIATGHYARLEYNNLGRIKLLRGVDTLKDQSYFLSTVSEGKLKKVIFPIGNLYKTNVKSIAKELNLITASKPESMGVCFIGEKKKFSDFLEQFIHRKNGKILTIDGKVIGLFAYTIGQCVKINYLQERWFVLKINVEDNTLIVVPGSTNSLLYSKKLVAKDWIWIWNDLPKEILQIKCKIIEFDHNNNKHIIEFKESVRAIAPGQ